MTFPGSFLPEETAAHPSVMGFLPSQPSATDEVDRLDPRQLTQIDLDGLSSRRSDVHAIEGAFVGVQGDQRRRNIRFRGLVLQKEGHSSRGDLELFDPDTGFLEPVSMIGSQVDVERTPFTIPKRETDLAGLHVEVEPDGCGPKERFVEVGDAGVETASNSLAMGPGQGDGDLGGHDGMRTGQMVDEGPGAGKPGTGTPRGLTGVDQVAEGGVGQ